MRSETQHQTGLLYTYTYETDVDSPLRVQKVSRVDQSGHKREWTLDDFDRVTSVTITPTNDANGRPRAADPDNGGVVEPLAITTNYTYSSCSVCSGKPSVIEELPSGRRWEYDYDPLTGLLVQSREPNPDGGTAPAVTSYTWQPSVPLVQYQVGPGRYDLVSRTDPDGSHYTYSYVSTPRIDSTSAVPEWSGPTWGKKHAKIQTHTPSVTITDGPSVILSTELSFNVTHPQVDPTTHRQDFPVGQLVEQKDANDVVTSYEYDVFGAPSAIVAGSNGSAAQQVRTEVVTNRNGDVTQVTERAYSALSSVTTISWDAAGRLRTKSTTVGGTTVGSQLFYDCEGNLAVSLDTNKDSQGGAPDDFGPSPRPDVARDWLRNEFHYIGTRLVMALADRRPLDVAESASDPVADAPNARFLRTDYVWSPEGRLLEKGQPNGALLRHVYDGYGSLFKSSTIGGESEEHLHAKKYVNSSLEVVRSVDGAGSVTTIERNDAGVVTRITEPSAAVPANYPAGWTVPSAVHEFTTDSMGRTTESRTLRAPGGPSNLVVRRATTFDQIGRPRISETFEGAASTAAETYSTVWQGLSNVAKITGPGGRYVRSEFSSTGRLVKRADSLHATYPNTVLYEYVPGTDLVGVVTVKNIDEAVSSSSYVERATEYVRDALGRVTEIRQHPAVPPPPGLPTPPGPLVHYFAYYSTGQTQSYVDPSGRTETYLPDALGRLIERFRPQGTAIWNGTTYLDWTASDNRTEKLQTDGLLHTTRTIYDFVGRTSIIMEPGAGTTEPTALAPQPFTTLFQYDAASHVSHIYGGDNAHSAFIRDPLGRLLGRYRAGGNQYVSSVFLGDWIERDVLGQVTKTQGILDGGLGVYLNEVFERDALGRTHRESYEYMNAPGWVDIVSSFSATDAGDRVRRGLRYNDGTATNDLFLDHTPDSAGRLLQMGWRTTAMGTSTPLAAYAHEGNMIRQRVTSYPLGSTSPGAFTTAYNYDHFGRMSGIDHAFTASGFDPAAAVRFHYDLASNLVKEVYEKQGVSGTGEGDRFAYDEHNRLTTAWLGSDAQTLDAPNPDTGTFVKKLTYGLDPANNRTNVATLTSAGTSNEPYSPQDASNQGPSNRYSHVGNQNLGYDDRGNLIFDGQHYFVYDVFNRLTEVYAIVGSSQQMAGAQLGESAAAAPALTGSLSGEQQSSFVVEDISALRHARESIMERVGDDLISVLFSNQQSPIAAQLREPLSSSVVQMVPTGAGGASAMSLGMAGQSFGETSTAFSPGEYQLELQAVYLYDVSDRRVVRWLLADSLYYYAYDGWQEVQELKFGLGAVKQFVWGEQLDELVAFRTKDAGGVWNSYYVAEGGAHCPSRVLDSQGNVVEVQECDPYGETTWINGGSAFDYSPIGNQFGWKGHRIDPETGLVYMRHRHYSPRLGRFATQDPIGGWADVLNHGNGYTYVANNPLTRMDRLGLQSQSGASWWNPLSWPGEVVQEVGALAASSGIPLVQNLGRTLESVGDVLESPATLVEGAVTLDGDMLGEGAGQAFTGVVEVLGLGSLLEPGEAGTVSASSVLAPARFSNEMLQAYHMQDRRAAASRGVHNVHASAMFGMTQGAGITELPWIWLAGLYHELDPCSQEIEWEIQGAWVLLDSPLDLIANTLGMLGGLILPASTRRAVGEAIGTLLPFPPDPKPTGG